MKKRLIPRLGFIFTIVFGLLSTYQFYPYPWNPMRPRQPTIESIGLQETRIPASLNNLVVNTTVARRCQNLYDWVCHREDETKDPTGTVRTDVLGERQALQIYQQIIKDHQDWTTEQIDEELVKQIYSPKRRNRLESAFRWVRKAILHFFEKQNGFTTHQKLQLEALLKRVELQLPPPAAVYADEPDLFTKDEVYYERTPNGQIRLRVGGAYLLVAKSWFNLVFTMAHELAHAIDPCELAYYGYKFPAYQRLKGCFIRTGLVAYSKQRSECGAHDQLSETFADWLAVHITAEALTVFSTEFHGDQILNSARNSIRDLCDQDDNVELDTEFHPAPKVRIDKIFGQNPVIRYALGCTNSYPKTIIPSTAELEYCTFDSAGDPQKNQVTEAFKNQRSIKLKRAKNAD